MWTISLSVHTFAFETHLWDEPGESLETHGDTGIDQQYPLEPALAQTGHR